MTSPQAPAALYVGIGCRRGCAVETLQQLLLRTLAAHALPLSAVHGLASIDLKADEPGLLQLAQRLDLPLVTFSAAQLRAFEPWLSHRSNTALRHSGCLGVAESAALALAARAGQPPRLTVRRQVGDAATLALASTG